MGRYADLGAILGCGALTDDRVLCLARFQIWGHMSVELSSSEAQL